MVKRYENGFVRSGDPAEEQRRIHDVSQMSQLFDHGFWLKFGIVFASWFMSSQTHMYTDTFFTKPSILLEKQKHVV